METILIDELVNDYPLQPTEKSSVVIEGKSIEGWTIAKPLNYEPKHTSFLSRMRSAINVLNGKAIAFQFFTDLSEEQKIAYVKQRILKNQKPYL